MRRRLDLDYDGAGRPEYGPEACDWIDGYAEEHGVSKDAAAQAYEAMVRQAEYDAIDGADFD